MNPREQGIEWQHPHYDLVLWMHPGSSFGRLSIVSTKLDRLLPRDERADETGNHTVNNFRSAFMIAEAFILNYKCKKDDDSPFIEYLRQRTLFNVEANLALFLNVLSYDDVEFLFDAFNATRPGKNVVVEDTPEKKENSEPASSKNGKAARSARTQPEPVPTGS